VGRNEENFRGISLRRDRYKENNRYAGNGLERVLADHPKSVSMESSLSKPLEASSMYKRLDRANRTIPLVLGLVTLMSVGLLLAWDLNPKFFPNRAHDLLAAFPLAMIAIAYLIYQGAHRPAAGKEFKESQKNWSRRSCWQPPFSSGLPINSGPSYPKRHSSTT
jgi:hypothetical protein